MRVITCGVRWGGRQVASYAQISIENNVAILGTYNRNIGLFKSAKKGEYIALKDGFNIIALGIVAETAEDFTWRDIRDYFLDEEGTKGITEDEKEKLAIKIIENESYGFTLDDEITIITIENWIRIDPPIYYYMVMSTVSIKDPVTIQECEKRFKKGQLNSEEYKQEQVKLNLNIAKRLLGDVISDDNITNEDKEEKLQKSLNAIDIVFNFEEGNAEALSIQKTIKDYSTNVKTKEEKISLELQETLLSAFQKKAEELKKSNKYNFSIFFIIVGVFISALFVGVIYPVNSLIPYSTLPIHIFFFAKVTLSFTIGIAVFWIARFFNRRIHENNHLIEEYEYRVILLKSFKTLSHEFSDDMKNKYLNQIILKITSNPNYALAKHKDDKIPTELLDIIRYKDSITKD